MKNFNFSGLSETSFVNNGSQFLRAYDIYEVNLTKIEKGTLPGKDGTNYDIITLEFTGTGESNGVYNHNLFIPHKDEDFERRINKDSGTKYPSAFEQFQYTLMQLVETINPAGATKIKENSSKIKSLEQFIELIIKALTNKNNVNFYLKLVGSERGGKLYSTLPNACVLAKNATDDTNPTPLNFVSTDRKMLNFTNYETSQMKKYQNAKPTNMDKEVNDEDNIDIDNIEV